MIIERLNDSFLLLSRCLFNSKNERTCQVHPEKSGCVFLTYYLELHHQSVGVHDFQFTTYFSPIADRHKNERTCQVHPEKSGCVFLTYYLELHHQSVGVHDFQFTTYFSPIADRHCPFLGDFKSSQV